MSDSKTYNVPEAFAQNALLDEASYKAMYEKSISDPAGFWAEQAEKFLDWDKPWDTVLDWDYSKGHIRWFEGGKLNACYNCVDRHLETRGDQTALIWEGDDPADDARISYHELHEHVCRMANVLKSRQVKKGDRVCIYMPMIPEAVYAMLACARIGAVHSVVFGGFSPESIKDRILDSDCQTVITADEGIRGGKPVPLKANVDQALQSCPNVHSVIVVRRTAAGIDWHEERDIWYHDAAAAVSADCPPEQMDAEDPLFILYTSGSTGKPKGVLHTTGGYLLYAAITHKYVFDYHDGDIYWCTADVGWVTGHSSIVYAPLSHGAAIVLYDGAPDFPTVDRWWDIIEKYGVSIFYTSPTAIRMFMRHGEEMLKKHDFSSLELLGSVGEPINPEAWCWYYNNIGQERCPIVDTWWQTETGGFMITPLPITPLKPGSATKPFFGNEISVVDEAGKAVKNGTEGNLVIKNPWPGMARTILGDPDRFIEKYWQLYKKQGWYLTGDSAKIDDDGYVWIIGRNDDVLKVSGYRLGSAEIESALVSHPAVTEAAAVGLPDKLKGNIIHATVILKDGFSESDELANELKKHVDGEIGPIARPAFVVFADSLPKTRSGKIMRRVLKARVLGQEEGDLSTLEE